jgi:hypothetical protein
MRPNLHRLLLISTALALFLGVPILCSFLFRPSAQEKADEAAYSDCEDKILSDWAVQDKANVRERLALVDKYCWGCWDSEDPAEGGKLTEYDVSQLKEVAQLEERT